MSSQICFVLKITVVGADDGALTGLNDGAALGENVGEDVGLSVGSSVYIVGSFVGVIDGDAVSIKKIKKTH